VSRKTRYASACQTIRDFKTDIPGTEEAEMDFDDYFLVRATKARQKHLGD
jgi:hypothetical protein